MLFSSPSFFVFFAGYFALHSLIPPQRRIWLIIIGGLIFYSYWHPGYFWIPPLLLLIAFGGTLWMAGSEIDATRRRRLAATIVFLLIPLAVFKYTNFVYWDVLGLFLPAASHLIDLPLPLGISFITFTLIAYAVDVYRGSFPAERRLPILAGHVIFFPHLIAGPILRPHELIPQLERPKPLRSVPFLSGIAIFTIGLVKKLVVADPLAATVEPFFSNPAGMDAVSAAIAIYGFSLQIYCDFSGYTDMAIGLALLLGVKLPNNFASPYASWSVVEFWRRWHITLSHWLRDYLYIPLGGNRFGLQQQALAIMATMTLGGLWHGANWTFVIWGALHGIALAATHVLRRFSLIPNIPDWLAVIITFHFVTLMWVFFRAPDLATVGAVFRTLVDNPPRDLAAILGANLFPLFLIAIALLLHRFDDHRRIRVAIRRLPAMLSAPVLAALWILAITVSAGSSAAFIYFDF